MLWLKQERKTHSALVKSGKSGNYKISQRYKKNKQCGGSIWICSVAFVVALRKQTNKTKRRKVSSGEQTEEKAAYGEKQKVEPSCSFNIAIF